MGESRQELLTWVNDLLQLNYTKIEQMGTGAALCQIFDSIYNDIQMSKVKFNTQQEYEYVNNFKLLQKCFTDHGLDKIVPVERLVKCKFQDNLEFTQWVKKHWDTFYPGGQYDPVSRRKGSVSKPTTGSSEAPRKTVSGNTVNAQQVRRPVSSAHGSAARAAANSAASSAAASPVVRGRPPMAGSNTSTGGHASMPSSSNNAMIAELNKQVTQLQVTVDGLEKERDFYFAKLRDVEIMVQTCLDDEQDPSSSIGPFAKKIQDILYSVAEGFEVPQEANQENHMPGGAVEVTY